MDGNETYPDPIGQAGGTFGQKVTEAAFMAALIGQVAGQAQARRAERDAAAVAAEETARAAAQAIWAAGIRDDATLPETARAWAAAAAWEHTDVDATAAADTAEDRLRTLHPYAMRKYDDLRLHGHSRVSAMRQAVPLFAMHPDPRPAPQDAWAGRYLDSAPGTDGDTPPVPGMDTKEAMRVMDILAGLNEDAAAAGRGPLTAEEAALALRQRVTAPGELIEQVIAGLRDGSIAVPATRTPRPTVTATGPAAADYPAGPAEAVAARGPAGPAAAPAAGPATATAVAGRPGPSTGPAAADYPAGPAEAIGAGRSRRRGARGPRNTQPKGRRRGLHL